MSPILVNVDYVFSLENRSKKTGLFFKRPVKQFEHEVKRRGEETQTIFTRKL